MFRPDKDTFLLIWPKCFIVFLAAIEILCVLMFFATDLCSIAANFWVTNVFAGTWCGLVVLAHIIAMFVAGVCAAGPPAAFRAVIVTVVMLVACAALISFNVAFVVRPTLCILTPSCDQNAYSSSSFSYSFRQNFFTTFNNLDGFKTYTESQVKLLCQYIQLGLAGLCFIMGVAYLVIYFECIRRVKKHQQVGPHTLKSSSETSFRDARVSPTSNYPRGPHASAPTSPRNVYLSQPPTQPMLMAVAPPQPMLVAPAPQPQMLVYPPPAPAVQPMYYAPAPPPMAPWRPTQPIARPWYAHQ